MGIVGGVSDVGLGARWMHRGDVGISGLLGGLSLCGYIQQVYKTLKRSEERGGEGEKRAKSGFVSLFRSDRSVYLLRTVLPALE